MKLIPHNPAEEQAEREAWEQGVDILKKINNARAQTGEEPLVVDQDAAPPAVKAQQQEAKRRREEEEELVEIAAATRKAELESARLQGEMDGMRRRPR